MGLTVYEVYLNFEMQIRKKMRLNQIRYFIIFTEKFKSVTPLKKKKKRTGIKSLLYIKAEENFLSIAYSFL